MGGTGAKGADRQTEFVDIDRGRPPAQKNFADARTVSRPIRVS